MKNAIANILHLHSSSGLYGAERVILNLGKSLDDHGYHPIIGSLEVDKSLLSSFARAAVESNLDTELIITKAKFSPVAIFKIVKLVREKKIKIIHSHYSKATVLGFFASRITGIPMIETNHLFPPMPLSDKKLQLYAKIGAFILRYADKTIAVSHKIKTSLEDCGVPSDRISVIENGIDVEKCRSVRSKERVLARRELGLEDSSFMIGSVGRLTEQKGFEYLLEAAKAVLTKQNNVVFIIAGDGPLREQLNNYVHELKLDGNVRFLGFRKDIMRILAAMDIFVMPSLDEGLPIAMLEAMAVGLPVIVTPVGEIPRVIENKQNGILIEPKNSEVLANKIIYLMENHNIRGNIVDKAWQTVKAKYSNEAMSESYALIYDRLLMST